MVTRENRMYGHHFCYEWLSREGINAVAALGSEKSCAQVWQFSLIFGAGRPWFSATSTVWTGFQWYLTRWCSQPWIFMDFHESTPTSTNSSSVMRTSLRNLRYTRTIYSSRSRDLATRKTRRPTARERKKSVKVGRFVILATRRCDPPYL